MFVCGSIRFRQRWQYCTCAAHAYAVLGCKCQMSSILRAGHMQKKSLQWM